MRSNARWRQMLLLPLLVCASLEGAAQSQQFRFERQLVPGGAGPNRIAPDVALLAGAASADLRDLRLFDAAGKETPYLLIPPEKAEPRWKPGKILPVASTKDTSGFEVDFGSAASIDRLRISGLPAPFLKRFQLEGSGDRSHWTLLAPEGTLFDLPAEKLQLTDVGFEAGEYRYLRVTWDDRKSGRVPEPQSVSARLLEARAPAAPLRMSPEFRRLGSAAGHSRFKVSLPGAHLPIVAVELGVSEARLLRYVRVTESLLSGSEVVQQTLGSATVRRVAQGDLTASDLRIPIKGPAGKEIEIVVEDDNNPPLDLMRVDLIFAPQPWIYLESPQGQSLTARYGDQRLTAPRYDLEAIRQYVGRANLKEAHWGESRDAAPAAQAGEAGIGPIEGGAIDVKSFRYSRAIPDSPDGLTVLELDAAVLALSRPDLADLRIADGSGRQIPYLLERRQDMIVVDVPMTPEKTSASSKQSRYRIELPFENLPEGKLTLKTTDRVFKRQYQVEFAGAKRPPTSGGWMFNDPEGAEPYLSLRVPGNLGTRTIVLVVDEGDNRPLNMSSPRLELPAYHLRFFYPPKGKLQLLYGNDRAAAPSYDLQLLAPRLVGVSSREISLASDGAAAAKSAVTMETRVFWTALAAAVIAILLLLARLLRREAVQS